MRQGDYQTDKKAEDYFSNRFNRGLKVVNQDEITLLEKVIHKYYTSKNLSVLDLGTGTGRILEFLLTIHPRILYGLDSSEAMLRVTEKRFRDEIESNKLRLLQTSSDSINLPGSSIDITTAFHLFKHLPAINPTLASINRILKKGGLFIFDTLNTNSIIHLNLGSCEAISEKNLKKALSENNFHIEEIIYLHFFGETIYKYLSNLIHPLDRYLSKLGVKFGTKMIVVTRKK